MYRNYIIDTFAQNITVMNKHVDIGADLKLAQSIVFTYSNKH